jgi:hypothetical protein
VAALTANDKLTFYNIFHIEIELNDSLLAAAVASLIQSVANNYCSVAMMQCCCKTATFFFKHLVSHLEVAFFWGGEGETGSLVTSPLHFRQQI